MAKIRKHIPNSLTLLNIGIGLASILYALNGNYVKSAGLILVSGIVDSFDGYIARRLKSTSKLGGYLDTVSDFIAFGLATGILVWTVFDVWIPIIIVFIVSSGYRLWYFMRMKSTGFFYGLPTTTCGGLLSTLVIIHPASLYEGIKILSISIPTMNVVMIILSILMLSRKKYYRLEIKGRRTLTFFLAFFLALFVLNFMAFIHAMMFLFLSYIVFGWLRVKE